GVRLQTVEQSPRGAQLHAPFRGRHAAACVCWAARSLTAVAGVDAASCNLSTEQATVAFDPARTDLVRLRAAVAAAGYELAEPQREPLPGGAVDRERAAREAAERRERLKFVVGAVLAAPVLLGSMADVLPWVPALL